MHTPYKAKREHVKSSSFRKDKKHQDSVIIRGCSLIDSWDDAFGSTLKNLPNPQSSKGKKKDMSKTRRRQKSRRNHPIANVSTFFEVFPETLGHATKQPAHHYFGHMPDMGQKDKEKLVSDLYLNSLDLFRLGQKVRIFHMKNIKKRMALLHSFSRKMNDSWLRLTNLMRNCDASDRQMIEEAVKSLVGQRLFLQKQISRCSELLEQLKL